MEAKGVNMEKLKGLLGLFRHYIGGKLKLIALFSLVGLLGGVYYAYQYKPYYISNISFLINESKSMGGSTLSALAGQFGMSSNSPGLSEDRIVYLVGTKKILGTAMLQPFGEGQEKIGDALAKVFRVSESWPSDTAMDDFKGFTSSSIEKASKQEQIAINQVLETIRMSNRLRFEAVKKKTNSFVGSQGNGVIYIEFECRNEPLSAAFVKEIYNQTSRFYINTITKNLQDNYNLILAKADSIQSELYAKEEESASANDASFNVFKSRGRLPEMRLRKEVELLNIMYAEIVKNKEIAKFNLDQERPVFQLVEEPFLPLTKKERSMSGMGLLGFLFFSLVGVSFFTMLFLFKNFRNFNGLMN